MACMKQEAEIVKGPAMLLHGVSVQRSQDRMRGNAHSRATGELAHNRWFRSGSKLKRRTAECSCVLSLMLDVTRTSGLHMMALWKG